MSAINTNGPHAERLLADMDLQDEGLPVTQEDWRKFREKSQQQISARLKGKALPDILLNFQKELMRSTSQYSVTVADKGRRTGATWGIGSDAVLTSGASRQSGGMDTLYIGYNLDMAREFIDNCAMWAKAFMPLCSEVDEFLFQDQQEGKEDRHIKAFRITFASGFEIVALSSRPRSLRGKQGYIILDEFAFHDEPDALLKAAMALLIWGGKVLVISTHNGADNAFNVLIEDIRKGDYGEDANVVRCTFDDAVRDGLYERICLIKGKEWTAEGEAKWRQNIRNLYRSGAAEELDCIPADGEGVYLPRSVIQACMVPPDNVVTLICPKKFELQPDHIKTSYIADWLDQHVAPLLRQLDERLRHGFGLDFARSGDASVYVPITIERDTSNRVPFTVEMRNVPYEQQKHICIWITEHLPRFQGGQCDSTGNGAYLGEVLQQQFGETRIERVILSQPWYADNMPRMKAGMEDRTLLFPANDNNEMDLRQVQMVRGIPKVPDNAKTKGTDGLPRHGDFAIALCLAKASTRMEAAEYEYSGTSTSDLRRAGGARGMAMNVRDDHDDDNRGRSGRFTKGGAW